MLPKCGGLQACLPPLLCTATWPPLPAAVALLCRLHVDAAYAGTFALLPELQHHFSGLEVADSFNTNPHKGRAEGSPERLHWGWRRSHCLLAAGPPSLIPSLTRALNHAPPPPPVARPAGLLTNFDCSAMWFRDASWASRALSLTPEFLKHHANDLDYKVYVTVCFVSRASGQPAAAGGLTD